MKTTIFSHTLSAAALAAAISVPAMAYGQGEAVAAAAAAPLVMAVPRAEAAPAASAAPAPLARTRMMAVPRAMLGANPPEVLMASIPSGAPHSLLLRVPAGVEPQGVGEAPVAPEGGVGQQVSDIKDDLFVGTEEFAKNATDVTEINMDPESLGMVSGRGSSKAHSMVLNVVRTYSFDKPGMYDMAAVDKYRVKLNTGEWRCSVHTRNMKTGSSSDVCARRRTDGLHETAIITAEPRSLTFIHTIRREGGDGSSVIGIPEMGSSFGVSLAPVMAMSAAWEGTQMAQVNAAQALARAQAGGWSLAVVEDGRTAEMQARVAEKLKSIDTPEFRERMQKMQEEMKRSAEKFRSREFDGGAEVKPEQKQPE